MEAIVELFVAIIGMIIHIFANLVGAVLGAGIMASRRKGISRTGYLLILLSCSYFLFGVLRFLVPAFSTPTLYGIYTTPVFIGAIVTFIIGAALAGAVKDTSNRPADIPRDSLTEDISHRGIIGFGLILLLGVFLTVSSTATTTKHQSSLRDRACAEYESRVSEGLRDTASNARDLAERLLGRQIAPDITCSEDT